MGWQSKENLGCMTQVILACYMRGKSDQEQHMGKRMVTWVKPMNTTCLAFLGKHMSVLGNKIVEFCGFFVIWYLTTIVTKHLQTIVRSF